MKKAIIVLILLAVSLILNRMPVEAHRNAVAATYALAPGAPPNISLGVLYSVPPYELQAVPYQKHGDALLFKTAGPNFRNEGTPGINVLRVATTVTSARVTFYEREPTSQMLVIS